MATVSPEQFLGGGKAKVSYDQGSQVSFSDFQAGGKVKIAGIQQKNLMAPQEDGVFLSIAKGIVTPFARFGVTAGKMGAGLFGAGKAAVERYALGDEAAAQETLKTAAELSAPEQVELPLLGKVTPYGVEETGGFKDVEGQTRDIIGGGLVLASYASGNPMLMGALAGGGTAIESGAGFWGTTGSAAGGAVLGKAGELAFRGAGGVLKGAGKALQTTGLGSAGMKKAAQESYARALAPTTRQNKALVNRIAPELAERRITAFTREGLAEQATAGVEVTGKRLAEEFMALPQDAKVAIDPVLTAIGKQKDKLFINKVVGRLADGSPIVRPVLPQQNASRLKIWQGVQDTITKLTSNGQAEIEGIRRFRQILDRGTYAKGLMTGSETARKEVEKAAGDILRGEIGKQYPSIGAINREFNFWSNLKRVTDATILRTTGQAKTKLGGKIATTTGAVIGGAKAGPAGAVEGATVMRYLHQLITSPGWQTISGAEKARIADYLAKGETTIAGNLMLKMAKGLGIALEKTGEFIGGVPQAIKETPMGEIPGSAALERGVKRAGQEVKATAGQRTLRGSVANPLAEIPSYAKKTSPAVGKTANKSLLEEAKKYKSAEEFVNKKGTYYSGRNGEMPTADNTGMYGNGLYLTNEKGRATLYGKNVEQFNTDGLKLYEPKDTLSDLFGKDTKYGDSKLITKKYKDLGYDGIKISKNGHEEIVIFDPLKVKTKSQLIDIWNKANPAVGQTAKQGLTQTAKGFKTAEAFIKSQEKNNPLFEAAKDFDNPDDFISFFRGSSTQYGKYRPEIRKFGTTEEAVRVPKLGVNPEKKITIYRGLDESAGKIKGKISDGDFVTTDYESAAAYSGGKVVSKEVKAKDLIVDYPSDYKKGDDIFYKGAEFIYSNNKNELIKYTDADLQKIYNEAKSYALKTPLEVLQNQKAYIQKYGKLPADADMKGFYKSPEFGKYGTDKTSQRSAYYEYVSNQIDETMKNRANLQKVWEEGQTGTAKTLQQKPIDIVDEKTEKSFYKNLDDAVSEIYNTDSSGNMLNEEKFNKLTDKAANYGDKLGFYLDFNDSFGTLEASLKDNTTDILTAQKKVDRLAKNFGFNLKKNKDGTITLYHGTTKENAKAIMKEGFESGSFFSPSTEVEYGGVNGAGYYGDTIVKVDVDPRELIFRTEGEFYVKGEGGLSNLKIWNKSKESVAAAGKKLAEKGTTTKTQDFIVTDALKKKAKKEELLKAMYDGVTGEGGIYKKTGQDEGGNYYEPFIKQKFKNLAEAQKALDSLLDEKPYFPSGQVAKQIPAETEQILRGEAPSIKTSGKMLEEPQKQIIRGGLEGAVSDDIGKGDYSNMVARERFNIPELKKISFGGSDRDVYDLGGDKVLKIAKTARGLSQNASSADSYAEQVGMIPKTLEEGKNYIVKEKTFPPDANTKKMIAELKKLGHLNNYYKDRGNQEFWNELEKAKEITRKYGYEGADDIDNFDILWNDFKAQRNWGTTKDGLPILVDEGTLSSRFTSEYRGKANLSDPEFRDIYYQSKAAKKKFKDIDTKSMYGAAGIGLGLAGVSSFNRQKNESATSNQGGR